MISKYAMMHYYDTNQPALMSLILALPLSSATVCACVLMHQKLLENDSHVMRLPPPNSLNVHIVSEGEYQWRSLQEHLPAFE